MTTPYPSVVGYETLSQEKLENLLASDGVVVIRLSKRRAHAAGRLLRMAELFRDGRPADFGTRRRMWVEYARGMWNIFVVAILHSKLIEMAAFFIIAKPQAWSVEDCDDEGSRITFVALR